MVQPTRFMPSSDAIGAPYYPARSPSFPRLPSVALGQSSDAVIPTWPTVTSSAPGTESNEVPHPPSPQLERAESTESVYALGLSTLSVLSQPDNTCPMSYD